MSTPTLRKLLILLFLVMVGVNAYQTWRIAFIRHEADFPAYLAGAHGLLNGTNPYLPTAVPPYNTLDNFRPFIYPLFIAWLWIPFALMPPLVASLLWYSISVAILVKVFLLLSQLLRITDERKRLYFFGALLVLFASVIQADMMFGQMNLFVLLLLLLGVKYSGESLVKSGFGFGAAISAKFMPIVLLPVLLVRSPRIAIMAGVAILVAAVGIPLAIAGPNIFGYYQYWFTHTIASDIGQKNSYGYTSFDLAGVLAQLVGMEYPTIIMRAACGLILLIFPLILIKRGSHVTGFFLSFLLLPLTGSRSEPNHLIILLPTVGLLVADLLERGRGVRSWFGLLALQLTILWGYNKAIPFDTAGLLVLFGIVFWKGLRESQVLKGGAAAGRIRVRPLRFKIRTP